VEFFSASLWPLILALVSGILMAVQGSLNAALSKTIGLLEATFAVHATGLAVVAAALFLFRMGEGKLAAIGEAPWFSYLGGIVGVFIIYLVAASIPKAGVANATTAIIVGQVLTALAIDHFGVFGLEKMPCSWPQLVGLILLAAGAKLLLRM